MTSPRRALALLAAALVSVPLLLTGAGGAASAGPVSAPASAAPVSVAPVSVALEPAAAEPLQWTLSRSGVTFPDPDAPGGSQVQLWSTGTATTTVNGEGQVVVHARAELCQGPPVMHVAVDGRTVGWLEVRSTVQQGWRAYSLGDFRVPAGAHEVVVTYSWDHRTPECDRNLHLGGVSFTPAPAQGRSWALDGNGVVLPDGLAPDRSTAHLWSNGTATTRLSGGGTLVVYARSDVCEWGRARMEAFVDGVSMGTATVPNDHGWWAYPLGPPQAAGDHLVQVRYLNDRPYDVCDVNLRVGGVAFQPGAAAAEPVGGWVR